MDITNIRKINCFANDATHNCIFLATPYTTQVPSPEGESALVRMQIFLFSAMDVSELPVGLNLLNELVCASIIFPVTICSMEAVSVIRKTVVLVKRVVPKEYFSSAITIDQAYPTPGLVSSGISMGIVFPVLIWFAEIIILKDVNPQLQEQKRKLSS